MTKKSIKTFVLVGIVGLIAIGIPTVHHYLQKQNSTAETKQSSDTILTSELVEEYTKATSQFEELSLAEVESGLSTLFWTHL